MPVRKLQFIPVVVETGRVVVEAVRRAGVMLLLPIGLLILVTWASSKLLFAGKPHLAASMTVAALGILAGWIMVLIVSRASLHARSGMDLLRPDRLALMLLGLVAGNEIFLDLVAAPQAPAFQALASIPESVVELLWDRATLLLGVSWAIGIEMTPAGSWKGLRGNFLRLLGFVLVCIVVLILTTLVYVYGAHGNLRLLLAPVPPVVWAVLFALSGVISSAVPCAIYRQLVMEPWPPTGTPEHGIVAA